MTSGQGASVVNSSAFSEVVFAGMGISCSNEYDGIGVLKWGRSSGVENALNKWSCIADSRLLIRESLLSILVNEIEMVSIKGTMT